MPFHGSISGGVKRFGLTGSSGPTNYPINITATANSSGQITINWTNASNNFSIRVYRGGTLITTLAKGTTSYANSGLTANTAYTYQLAYFGSGMEKKEPSNHSATTCYGNGAYVSNYCVGNVLYNNYADGSCGTTSSSQGNVNGYCGYCDPAGTNYGFQYCSGTQSIYNYADGSCGSYNSGSYVNNQCGYCDPYGTDYGNVGYYCVGQQLWHYEIYANGSCGTYQGSVNDGYNQGSCGYYYPHGTLYWEYCSGNTRVGLFWDGSGGLYYATIGQTQGYCGYCDPYGTFYGTFCSGGALYNSYANGSCGTYSVLQSNCDCGTCGCGCPAPLSVNCFLHQQFSNICVSFYIESNTSTSYGNITSHGIYSSTVGTVCDNCNGLPNDRGGGGGNYDGGKQNYYYYWMGAGPSGCTDYSCYSTNDTGNYAIAGAGTMCC